MRKKRFSTHVFLEQLQKRNMQSKMHRKQTPGMFRIIEYLYAGVDASKVDFDSFTLDELEYVYNEAHALYSMEDIYDEEIERVNWYNVIYEYVRSTQNIYTLLHSRKKQYAGKDDFI
ncbi:hypothetical protein [Brevibacillus sp. FSL K6-2834]|uniref:hypothetical protein n=1 Tax=Brevibacillus sp. FSL K6-2834 TaxID=2954680 RepID=UPI0031587864